jgi:hypothetical protein
MSVPIQAKDRAVVIPAENGEIKVRVPLGGEQGQTLLELLASISTVAVTLGAAGWLLKVEWDQGKCAYVVFEKTHAQVAHSRPPRSPAWLDAPVGIEDFPDAVKGDANCGESHEAVTLPKLEPEEIGL